MFKVVGTSSSYQLMLKDECYVLEQDDINQLYYAVDDAIDALDMDALDEIDRLNDILEALKKVATV